MIDCGCSKASFRRTVWAVPPCPACEIPGKVLFNAAEMAWKTFGQSDYVPGLNIPAYATQNR